MKRWLPLLALAIVVPIIGTFLASRRMTLITPEQWREPHLWAVE